MIYDFPISRLNFAMVTETHLASLHAGLNIIRDISKKELASNLLCVRSVYAENADRAYIRANYTEYSTTPGELDLRLFIKDQFRLSLVSSAVATAPVRISYWIFKPTIADKLILQLPLDEEEESLREEEEISVEDGSLPLTLERRSEFFKEVSRCTVCYEGTFDATASLIAEYAAANEVLVLRSLYMEKPPDETYVTDAVIRADDIEFNVRAYCLGTAAPFFLPCSKLLITLTTNKSVTLKACATFSKVRKTKFVDDFLKGEVSPYVL